MGKTREPTKAPAARPHPAGLDEVVRRIVAAGGVRAIYRLPPDARNPDDWPSEIDLLVVSDMPDDSFQAWRHYYGSARGLGVCFDMEVTDPEAFAADSSFDGTAAHSAVTRGKSLYNRE